MAANLKKLEAEIDSLNPVEEGQKSVFETSSSKEMVVKFARVTQSLGIGDIHNVTQFVAVYCDNSSWSKEEVQQLEGFQVT